MAPIIETCPSIRTRNIKQLSLMLCILSMNCNNATVLGEVAGVVSKDGKPLPHIEVIFYPDHEMGTKGPETRGYTDTTGRFELKNDNGGLGVTVGQHRVCLVDMNARQKLNLDKAAEKPPRIDPKYGSVATTPLRRIAVESGRQIRNFEVP